jgi:DNA polymerase-3 subunit epsilon
MEDPAAVPVPRPHPPFVAIDFETADRGSDSACAVALVRVEGLCIVQRRLCLLRPPRRRFQFTYVHGLTWADVAAAPTFADAWPQLSRLLDGAAFLAAHYAPFDRGVLDACCRAAGLPPPGLPFTCTMALARRTWGIYPTKLPDVCARLGLPLRHHDPASDAEACARIVIEAARCPQPAAGWGPSRPRTRRRGRGSAPGDAAMPREK